jgi:hypothetical protein
MNTTRQSFNWLIDAGLLLGFLAAFFLDLTGQDVHQWLGVALGSYAGYHLLRHWDWVRAVTAKFFSRTQPRVLAYYTLDAALLLGFFLIISTGVVISSWLSLAAGAYAVWKNLHVYSSVITLLLVLLKIGLHWRWIVKTAGRIFGGSQTPRAAAPALAPAAASAGINRRHFLTLMGVVGLASAAAVSNVVAGQQTVKAEVLTTGTASTNASSTTANTSSSNSTCVLRCN